jgi:hypothetical protein
MLQVIHSSSEIPDITFLVERVKEEKRKEWRNKKITSTDIAMDI